jgi:hypothetical protein
VNEFGEPEKPLQSLAVVFLLLGGRRCPQHALTLPLDETVKDVAPLQNLFDHQLLPRLRTGCRCENWAAGRHKESLADRSALFKPISPNFEG